MALTPAPVFVGDPDAAAAEGDRAGLAADRRSLASDPAGLSGRPAGPRRAAGRRPRPSRPRPRPRRCRRRAGPACRPVRRCSGSSRVRVPSGSLVTQIASEAAATRSGAAADRDRLGDVDAAAAAEQATTPATRQRGGRPQRAGAGPLQPPRRAAGPKLPARCGRGSASRRRAPPTARAPASPPARRPRARGRRRSAPRRSGSARRGPWRRRARSPRPAPPASPARCRPPCARRGRSRSAPRRGRSRASRRRRRGPTAPPRHCSGDMYSAVPTTEVPLCWAPLSPSALARPKSERKARSPSTRTLWGLTSRWTMPAAWAASSASATWPSRAIARAGGSGPSRSIAAPQVAALDQPHRHDQLAVDLARVEDRHHRRVVEAGGEPGLAQEALAEALAVGQLAGDHLQRHRPFQAQVGRPVDDAHPTPRDQRVEAVAGDGGADDEFCHRLLIRGWVGFRGPAASAPESVAALSEPAARR